MDIQTQMDIGKQLQAQQQAELEAAPGFVTVTAMVLVRYLQGHLRRSRLLLRLPPDVLPAQTYLGLVLQACQRSRLVLRLSDDE